jgi:hypothetical protein
MNITFTVPVGMPETITLTVTPDELLALTAALDQADAAVLADNGVREEVIEVVDELYEQVETVTAALYGSDWDLLTSVEGENSEPEEFTVDYDEDAIFPLDAYAAGRF